MTAKLQSKVLVLAVLGTIGAAYAGGNDYPPPPPPPSGDGTTITNTISNSYSNTATQTNTSVYSENLSVRDVFDPELTAMANASVNDIQKNLGNKLTISDPSTASVTNSVQNTSGNVGANNASGFFNQQANNVSVASLNAADDKGSGDDKRYGGHGASGAAARASVSFEQMNKGNSYDFGQNWGRNGNKMEAKIDGSVHDTSGNVGLNNAAGAGNQQKNDVALAVASSGVLASASTGGVQLNLGTMVMSDQPLNTSATMSGSVWNTSGNVGVNNAAGLGNQQVNTLSIAAVTAPVMDHH